MTRRVAQTRNDEEADPAAMRRARELSQSGLGWGMDTFVCECVGTRRMYLPASTLRWPTPLG